LAFIERIQPALMPDFAPGLIIKSTVSEDRRLCIEWPVAA
jgi:hypothetical protein